MFEEKFKPERDFVEFLLDKKNKHLEQYCENAAED